MSYIVICIDMLYLQQTCKSPKEQATQNMFHFQKPCRNTSWHASRNHVETHDDMHLQHTTMTCLIRSASVSIWPSRSSCLCFRPLSHWVLGNQLYRLQRCGKCKIIQNATCWVGHDVNKIYQRSAEEKYVFFLSLKLQYLARRWWCRHSESCATTAVDI